MSLGSAQLFCKKVMEDNDFQKKLETAKDDAEFEKLVKEEGFDFTVKELKQTVDEAKGSYSADRETGIKGGHDFISFLNWMNWINRKRPDGSNPIQLN